ncbi:hypothetical protein BRADI_1g49047v3 [Brachypodium distachyon]|uniref:Uncharacterized protein n=1 Tax=Brachypodium distachyon TaxID=15368 RepID=A0A2K2DQG1_BRADI|nr:hypothetical protein BRADI_1g49047v3 [Brachypodium distachyon]
MFWEHCFTRRAGDPLPTVSQTLPLHSCSRPLSCRRRRRSTSASPISLSSPSATSPPPSHLAQSPPAPFLCAAPAAAAAEEEEGTALPCCAPRRGCGVRGGAGQAPGAAPGGAAAAGRGPPGTPGAGGVGHGPRPPPARPIPLRRLPPLPPPHLLRRTSPRHRQGVIIRINHCKKAPVNSNSSFVQWGIILNVTEVQGQQGICQISSIC